MNRKFVIANGILLVSIGCLFLLWKQPVLLSVLLLLIAYGKHKLYPIKSELLWFVLICIGGGLVEILLVNFGHAWSYTQPQLYDIPIWMPIFWGLVGTTVIVMHEGLTKKRS